MSAPASPAQHTPAPWFAREPNGFGMGWRVGPAWLGDEPGSDRTTADARLIASAPELLVALKMAYRHLNGGSDSLTSMEHAEAHRLSRAAIAQATGAPA